MHNSHIIITGANGFIGKYLSVALFVRGARVSQIVRSASPVGHPKRTQYVFDLNDRIQTAEVFSLLQPDYVIHLAGLKNRSYDAWKFRQIYDTNLLTSLNVIDACRVLKNLKRFVFLGTCDEYGQVPTPFRETQREGPTSAYGLSKLAVTNILLGLFHKHRFPSIVLRPTVVYGPGQGAEMFLSALIQTLLAGKDFEMTTGEQRRDFIYINDVVAAIVKAVNADERINGSVINIGAGISCKIKEIAFLVADQINSDLRDRIKFGSIQCRPNEVMDYSVSITRAQELLNWVPCTKLMDGIQQTIKYFKESSGKYIEKGKDHA